MAEFFVRLGEFSLAQEIFEEALDSRMSPQAVKTARDFTIVFNSFVKFLFTLYKLEPTAENLEYLEALLAKRAYLLQETVLITASNDVNEWLKLL